MEPSSYQLKHYKDGEYHKDYDRRETVHSMATFLRDPSGDVPWDEDEQGVDVVHINDVNVSGNYIIPIFQIVSAIIMEDIFLLYLFFTYYILYISSNPKALIKIS